MIVAALALVAGCSPGAQSADGRAGSDEGGGGGGGGTRSDSGIAADRDSLFTRVTVYYGTDRAAAGSDAAKVHFGAQRGTLSYGRVDVTIPTAHEPGHLESPTWYKLEFHEDPALHVVMAAVTRLDPAAWSASLKSTLARSPQSEMLLYVHGYNVTIEDAARRAGQLAYDLAFPGPAAFYSWPSRGSLAGYAADEATIDRAVPNLAEFLRHTIHTTPVRRLHIIAHSMGSRALSAALQRLTPEESRRIGQVVFAAPDIDAEVFATEIVPALATRAEHITMYSSSRDRALLASMKVHAYPRAGMSGPEMVVVQGLETIDASSVDTDMLGHGYYASNKAVIDDMVKLIRQALPAARRPLVTAQRNGQAYWRLP